MLLRPQTAVCRTMFAHDGPLAFLMPIFARPPVNVLTSCEKSRRRTRASERWQVPDTGRALRDTPVVNALQSYMSGKPSLPAHNLLNLLSLQPECSAAIILQVSVILGSNF